ncbi:hypothetical protein SRB5_70500 [Streptomyces sp. RB5]|uniref:DUF4352 domain-containing protein n=1 Tax=Streptomyces smaragdinus TaxID=2585196 RepID=A0A7K0CTN7_9ACTN|nr:DUF4352 domain-containing protein [Streptomyces smaragdinus]MQY16847.1 hypothetical protein [Streptomyces smaragdinus]
MRRTLVPAVVVLAALSMGTMTACNTDKPKKSTSSSSSKGSSKSKGSTKTGTDTKNEDGPLAGGDTAEYDGMKITVSKATAFAPTEFAAGHTEGNKAWEVTVTLENSGSKKFDATLTMVSARAGDDGKESEQIFDEKTGEGFTGAVLPGKKATASFAFDTPADAKVLDVEVSPGDFDKEAAQWSIKL